MKRLLLLTLCLLVVAVPVAGLTVNFQNAGDLSNTVDCYGTGVHSCAWNESSVGKNNNLGVTSSTDFSGAYIINKNSIPTTYAAATFIGGSFWSGSSPIVNLYDSSFASLTTLSDGYHPNSRYEMKIIGGTGYLYRDGTVVSTSGALAVNPSYVGFGTYNGGGGSTGYWDNIIWGDSDSKYVVSMPETNDGGAYKFLLKKSAIGASSGLANGNTYVVVSSNNMSTTWSKNNANSETMYLKHTGTGEIVGTEPVSGYTGTVVWPLNEDVFNKITAQAPYGSYVAYLSGSPATLSTPIQYVRSGATIAFNLPIYSAGDRATITWNIQNDYWALRSSGYTFSSKVFDVYGQTKGPATISTQTGSGFYTFATTDPDGVYYVALIATDPSGNEIWLSYDYATVTGYLTFTGWVNSAQTARNLTVANVTIVQSGTVFTTLTVDGNYTTAGTAFGSGLPVIFNVTASGYQAYNYTMTPLATKTVLLNFTLNATNMVASGVSGMGIVRDSDFGRPLAGAVITYANVSHGTMHSATTNNAGYYLIDNANGGPLVSGYCYLVNASLARYTQVSPMGMKCVV